MPIISVSVPKQQLDQLNQLERYKKQNKSQIIRDALDLMQFETKWSSLRQTGDLIAKKLNIGSDDDVEQIAG